MHMGLTLQSRVSARRLLRRAFTDQEHADNQYHDDRHIQADVHQVLIELGISHVRDVGQLRAGSQNPSCTGDDADGQVRLQIQHLRL